jgi:hypothetical protein
MISASEAGRQVKQIKDGLYKDELLNRVLSNMEKQILEAIALGQTKAVCFVLYYFRPDISKLAITRMRDLGYKVTTQEGLDSTCIVEWSAHAK